MLHDDRNREEVRQLEDDFFDWLETADAEELESGTLDGFLEELERVDPLPGGFDPERSLADFHEKYAAFLEPQSRGRRQNRMSRRAFWAVAAVIAVLASMVTVQAFGMDIFGFFGRWTDEQFTFTGSADKAGYQEKDRNYPFAEGETAEFSTLDEALEAFRINLPLVPHWFPERFGELEVTGSVMPSGMLIFASSGEGEQFLTVEYSEFGEDGPAVVVEKDKNETIVYETNGMRHYIVTDHGDCRAAWTVDNILCIICAPITVEEMERIIGSIYSDIDRKRMIELIYTGNGGDPALASGEEKLHYRSIEEALEEFQLDIAAPKWFPEQFGELEVTGTVMPGQKSIYAWVETDQKDFLGISYAKYGEGIPGTVIEKDGNSPVLYESGGVRHYLLTDHNWRKAAWIQDGIECIIGGTVTEEEMKRIIDSIYLDGEKEAPSDEYAGLLQAALDECGISGEFVPTWYPEGFEASEPEIIRTSRSDIVNTMFQDAGERFFSIRIHRYHSSEDVESFIFEKDKTPVEQYTSGTKTVYILSNNDTITTTWSDGLIFETICGNLTVEEFKKIIDSIDS
ncbi:DUF4367 domain-containing protein [uncultured Oscillibacter sp.]|uniref:DUF4367 domain-containing protein n=2 Tax=uncultured Oscillibacter sp. TaxID=876091 RepID=UPI0026068014|nr:DUF4367 domain-containing protein [uncultured Oscillibacter sp.]